MVINIMKKQYIASTNALADVAGEITLASEYLN